MFTSLLHQCKCYKFFLHRARIIRMQIDTIIYIFTIYHNNISETGKNNNTYNKFDTMREL